MMEEERKCSSKEHRGGENKLELHQFDTEREGGRAYEKKVLK